MGVQTFMRVVDGCLTTEHAKRPLRPLLANVLQNELYKELEHRGHTFVRYADDGLIFCKSLSV